MNYISTRNKSLNYDFSSIFLRGLAPDGGLFIPKKLPFFSKNKLNKLKKLSYNSLAEKIIFEFCSDEFNKKEIKN